MEIRIDTEFKTLIPPLTEDEYLQLEDSCVRHGIIDTLKVWNGILIDGHNRFRIAEDHGLPYKTKNMEFACRDDAKRWILENQLGRRNLDPYTRSVLALKLKPLIAEKAKEKQATHTEQGYQKSDKAEHTVKQLARIAGVSHDTIHKVDVIENSGNEEIKEKVRSGEMSINKGYREIKDSQRVVFIETDESAETVDDVEGDVKATFALHIASEIEAGMQKISNVNKYSRTDVVGEIRDLKGTSFQMDAFRGKVKDCIKFLVHLENGLIGA